MKTYIATVVAIIAVSLAGCGGADSPDLNDALSGSDAFSDAADDSGTFTDVSDDSEAFVDVFDDSDDSEVFNDALDDSEVFNDAMDNSETLIDALSDSEVLDDALDDSEVHNDGLNDSETVNEPTPGVYLANVVVDAPGHTGEGFKDANKAANGVYGAGQYAGSYDVFSLGYEEGFDNSISLSWGGAVVQNGPGTDFVVFENGFQSGPSYTFMDLIVVMLSIDGENFVAFPHDYTAADETKYEPNPELWPGFAGRYPVKYNQDSNPVDPFDFELAGGDHFDLDDLPMDGGLAQQIKEQGFRFIKLVSAHTVINPDTNEPFVKDPMSNGPDIDGVIARYLLEDAE